MRKGYTWLLIEPEHTQDTQPSAVLSSASSAARYGDTDPRHGALPSEARLFVRGDQSIRITRYPATTTLVVCGPGARQNSHEFDSTVALEEFLQSFEQRVLGSGWVLVGVADRRASACS